MTSTITDQAFGASSTVAVKAPCRVASTSNLTLSGLQTIDGVALAENDRVLVTGQTDKKTNGVYIAFASTWLRAGDFDGNNDFVKGTRVLINEGTYAGVDASVTTENPIVIGTSEIEFSFNVIDVTPSAAMATVIEKSTVAAAASELGLGTEDTPTFNGLNIGASTATITAGDNVIIKETSAGVTTIGKIETLTVDATGNTSNTQRIVGTNPCFRATGSTQSVKSSSYTLAAYGTKTFDRQSNYDNTAGNYAFVAPIAGVYSINALAVIDVTGTRNCSISIYKGGSSAKTINYNYGSSGTAEYELIAHALLLLAKDDRIQIYLFQDSGSPQNFTVDTFDAHLVSL